MKYTTNVEETNLIESDDSEITVDGIHVCERWSGIR